MLPFGHEQLSALGARVCSLLHPQAALGCQVLLCMAGVSKPTKTWKEVMVTCQEKDKIAYQL